MKERPIIFSGPMVCAILAGAKTQTRRVMRDQPCELLDFNRGHLSIRVRRAVYQAFSPQFPPVRCPYGKPGDRLWVRETWQAFFDDEVPTERPRGPRHTLGQPARPDRKSFVFYKADGPEPVHPDGFQALWKSPIQLPRKYSRITLEVTGVRVERLQDISRGDAMAEGCPFPNMAYGTSPTQWFKDQWIDIYGPGEWRSNPWVWVVEFKRV